MRIDILTLFPPLFDSVFSGSIIKKAVDRKIVKIKITDIRDFAEGRHKAADDKPYGGGAGMVMMAPPVVKAIEKVKGKSARSAGRKVILLSPQGLVFNQTKARELSKYKHLIFVCGHYGGVDERILKFVDEEISIGDYVLTGGEIPSMVIVDAVVRILPQTVSKTDSVENDSHWKGGLASSLYTRPCDFRGLKVPAVLLSGNHEKIKIWRKENAHRNTLLKRPELLKKNTGG